MDHRGERVAVSPADQRVEEGVTAGAAHVCRGVAEAAQVAAVVVQRQVGGDVRVGIPACHPPALGQDDRLLDREDRMRSQGGASLVCVPLRDEVGEDPVGLARGKLQHARS